MSEKPRKKKFVARTAKVLGVVVILVVCLYLWAIFRPTGVERLRQEKEELIASVPAPSPAIVNNQGQLEVASDVTATTNTVSVCGNKILQLQISLSQAGNCSLNNSWNMYYITVEGTPVKPPEKLKLLEFYIDQNYTHFLRTRRGELSKAIMAGCQKPSAEEMNQFLDQCEQVLFTEPILLPGVAGYDNELGSYHYTMIMKVGALVTLRSYYRGETELGSLYLRSLFSLMLSPSNPQLHNWSLLGPESVFSCLVLMMNEIAPMDENLLKDLQQIVEESILSEKESEVYRYKYLEGVFNQFRYRLKSQKEKHPKQFLLKEMLGGAPFAISEGLFNPLVEKNLEELEKALLAGEIDAIEDIQKRMNKNFSMQFLMMHTDNFPGLNIFPQYFEKSADGSSSCQQVFREEMNNDLYMLQFILASLRYYNSHDEYPTGSEQLIPEYLYSSYVSDSQSDWYIEMADHDSGNTFPIFEMITLKELSQSWFHKGNADFIGSESEMKQFKLNEFRYFYVVPEVDLMGFTSLFEEENDQDGKEN